MLLPVLPLETVYHVGTFQGYVARAASLEGDALSVSLCPDAWRAIARIGGAPVWRLHRPGARFLDALRLDDATHAEVIEYAVTRNLLQRTTRWRIWSTDAETDARQYMEVADAGAVRRELGLAPDDPIPDTEDEEGLLAEQRPAVAATGALLSRLGQPADRLLSSAMATDLALIALAEDTGLDGVYWRETHAPELLSAPRAAIPQTCVPRFQATRLADDDTADDSDLLAGLPHPILMSLTPAACTPRPSAAGATG